MENRDLYKAIILGNRKEVLRINSQTNSKYVQAICLAVLGYFSKSLRIIEENDTKLLTSLEKMQTEEVLLIIAASQKKYKKTQQLAIRIAEKHPDSFLGHFKLAQIYKMSRQWYISYEHLKVCNALIPDCDSIIFDLASLALKLKKRDDFLLLTSEINQPQLKSALFLESRLVFRLLIFPLILLFLFLIKNPYVIVGLFSIAACFWLISRSRGIIVLESLLAKVLIGFGLYYLGYIVIYNIYLG